MLSEILTQAEVLLYGAAFRDQALALQAQFAHPKVLSVEEVIVSTPRFSEPPEVKDSRRAQVLYTSGTTGKPKDVVTTHANILAQVQVLLEVWGWKSHDFALHTLPPLSSLVHWPQAPQSNFLRRLMRR